MGKRKPHKNNAIVSDEGERLILVGEDDRPAGFASKAECHNGNGLLHRAFSLFVLDAKGRILMQQRSPQKRLWPMYWSNSCCSHPREGETMEEGSEYEYCWVYLGRSDEPVRYNRNEIASWCREAKSVRLTG